MSINIGLKVQVWNEATHQCLGWGEIIRIAIKVGTAEDIPFIQLESGKKIWGNRCSWIEEKSAIQAGIRIWKAIKKNEK